MKQNIAPMQLLLSIVERGSAAKLMRQYEAFKITQHFQAFGHGTAASHLLDTLGFGTSERDILLSIAPKDTMRQLMYFLRDEGRSDLGAKGIACSLDLTAISAIYALGISRLEEMNPEKGEQLMEQGNQHTLILVAVNYGYTDAVMDTARACGAKGGTVIRARWAGSQTVEKFAGITLQDEKEILAIVASRKEQAHIMEEINRLHGLRSSPQAVVIGLPIDHMAKLD
jgi:hypothetical protein